MQGTENQKVKVQEDISEISQEEIINQREILQICDMIQRTRKSTLYCR